MNLKLGVFAFFAFGILAGCVGGSLESLGSSGLFNDSRPSRSVPDPATQRQFADRQRTETALDTRFDAQAASTNMPTTGTAEYRGIAVLSDDGRFNQADIDMTADLKMTANFAPGGGTINGSLSNFLYEEDDNFFIPLRGSLTIADAAITNTTFSSTISGTLVEGGDRERISGTINGQFRGNEGAMIGADITLRELDDNDVYVGRATATKQ